MKNLTKIFFLFTFLIVNYTLTVENSPAQWIQQYQYTPFVGLYDVEFINQYTGWACGSGIILKTTNGGKNWIEQVHPASNKHLYGIYPIDSNDVYCVGFHETILKSTNGGNNWISIRNGNIGEGSSYHALFFLNKDTGWVIGTGFKILKTYDGFNSFDSINTSASFIFDLKFKDANTGILCGISGQVKKTTNGGYNWFNVNIQLNGWGSDFEKIGLVNNQFCWLAGSDGRIFKSTDFGSNWDSISYITPDPWNAVLYTCEFADENTGFVGGSYGVLYKSTNGGYTWKREETYGHQGYISSFWFLNNLTGWLVGGATKIWFTETGGLTNIYHTGIDLPQDYILYQNFPNPFNPSTKIKFSLKKEVNVKIKIFDSLGKEISELINSNKSPGVYEIEFKSSNLPSGLYYYSLFIDDRLIDSKKMIMVR